MKDARQIYKERYSIDFTDDYEVHHLDLNEENNDIENLLLMPKELNRTLTLIHAVWFKCKNEITINLTDFTNGWEVAYLKEWLKIYEELKMWDSLKLTNYANLNLMPFEGIRKK